MSIAVIEEFVIPSVQQTNVPWLLSFLLYLETWFLVSCQMYACWVLLKDHSYYKFTIIMAIHVKKSVQGIVGIDFWDRLLI